MMGAMTEDAIDKALPIPNPFGRALKLPPEDAAILISAGLLACGLAPQGKGFPGAGIRPRCAGQRNSIDAKAVASAWWNKRCGNQS
jgi:hypothetical protein